MATSLRDLDLPYNESLQQAALVGQPCERLASLVENQNLLPWPGARRS